MEGDRTREERVEERSIPEVVRGPFAVLGNEVTWMHYRWKVYKQLYADPRRVELLNATAPGFFGLLQRIWEDRAVLDVARVLDRTGGSTSLRVLVDRARPCVHHAVASELEERIGRLEAIDGAIRDHRNKRIGHIDAEHHPKGGGKPLPPIEGFDRFFEEIGALMNVVGVALEDATTAYSAVESLSDGDTLVLALRKAVRFDELLPEVMDRWAQLLEGRFGDLDRSEGASQAG